MRIEPRPTVLVDASAASVTPTRRGDAVSPPVTPATAVCLVRHGETDWNRLGKLQGREDVPLNDAGYRQAERCAAYLRASAWSRVVTSPLLRAQQTAAVIAERLGLPQPETEVAFAERDYGLASGKTNAEVAALFPDGQVPGMEPREAVRRRAMAGLVELARRYPGERLVVAAHGGVINAILAELSAGEIGSGKTTLANACINIVHLRDGAWQIELFNSVVHLAPDDV